MTLLDLPDVTSHHTLPDAFHDVRHGRLARAVPFDRVGLAARIVDEIDAAIDARTDVQIDGAEEEQSAGSSYARCADGNGTLTHLFFSDDEFDIARAKAICGKCGLAANCLEGALDRAESYGVWGGQLLVDGEIVAVKRGRGRPPKTPRPALVVDEVPVPPHLVA